MNKSPGPDDVSGLVLKKCALSLANPLTILFNISCSTGQIPTDWNSANVVPVHKKGDKTNVENYRPISLTSLVMKVMERIIRDELYMKCHNRIGDKQYGFLPYCPEEESCPRLSPHPSAFEIQSLRVFSTDCSLCDKQSNPCDILLSAYVMTATDGKALRNLIRETEFSANWVIKTQLVQL